MFPVYGRPRRRYRQAWQAPSARPQIAYVVSLDANTVTPINTATNKAGKPIKVGINPNAIAITPNGKTAYVTNSGSSTVTPISTATSKAGTPIKVAGAGYVAITPNGSVKLTV